MSLMLVDGSHIGVIGGGPAGSFFSYFALTFAERVDLDLQVDIYESRDFTQPGPGGCNMCGGIISETLVQYLAAEGIDLPGTVMQRGIDSYVLHTSDRTVRIGTPVREKRIAAIYRGGGPRDISEVKWGGLDGHLLGLAADLGAEIRNMRVTGIEWDDGRPRISCGEENRTYDLLVGAVGVNSPGMRLIESLDFGFQSPKTTKTYITELDLGQEEVTRLFGSSMNLFLTDIHGLHFAAIIPKGDFATVCLLGDEINREMIEGFFSSQAVRNCFRGEWEPEEGACHCSPKINIREAARLSADRIVLVGDAGVTRLYKDGIGAAYRTAKAAAKTAVFAGVSQDDFHRHYRPACRAIARDNRYGLLIFTLVDLIHRVPPLTRGTLRLAAWEQSRPRSRKRLSNIMWDMFTGSANYRDIFLRSLNPLFWVPFLWTSLLSLKRSRPSKRRG